VVGDFTSAPPRCGEPRENLADLAGRE
jgi:hypothetical protein